MKSKPVFSVSHNCDKQILSYLSTVSTVRFEKSAQCYVQTVNGRDRRYPGLLNKLKYRFYKHYKDNRSKRGRNVRVRGSTSAIGSRVDDQLARVCALKPNAKMPRLNQFTKRLLSFFESNNLELQAAQVPVFVSQFQCLTCADLLTRNKTTGEICMWEVKTGMPIGFFRKQGILKGVCNIGKKEFVECTKQNIWQLQRHFTANALVKSGLKIQKSRVIQVYKHKTKGLVVKVFENPPWCRFL